MSNFLDNLKEAVGENPLSAALIGGGALWLLFGNERLKSAAASVSAATNRPPTAPEMDHGSLHDGHTLSEITSAASGAANAIKDLLWTIVIGFIAGVIAKFVMPGDNEPSGFILTTILGIVGAFVATYLGQSLGWYRVGEGAGLFGAIVGAIIVLLIYGFVAGRRRTV
jgi:uncharacterized membrane protein YeaQ/YmgE (transglycosylase-associated protein family)